MCYSFLNWLGNKVVIVFPLPKFCQSSETNCKATTPEVGTFSI